MKKIIFTSPTDIERAEYADLFEGDILNGRVKIVVNDDGHTAKLFVEQKMIDRLGEEYIRCHISMRYSEFCGEWHARISENDYYNDPRRNPEKIISVVFDGLEGGTGREVYKGVETGRYYLRENYYPRENFAKWFVCGKRRRFEDGDEPRANLIFEHNGQREKVRYDDWNGVAAYSDTFNKDFGGEK